MPGGRGLCVAHTSSRASLNRSRVGYRGGFSRLESGTTTSLPLRSGLVSVRISSSLIKKKKKAVFILFTSDYLATAYLCSKYVHLKFSSSPHASPILHLHSTLRSRNTVPCTFNIHRHTQSSKVFFVKYTVTLKLQNPVSGSVRTYLSS